MNKETSPLLAILILLVLGFSGVIWCQKMEPTPEQEQAMREQATLRLHRSGMVEQYLKLSRKDLP